MHGFSTKVIFRKLDGIYTRMLRAILNKSWRQHPQNSNCTATYHLSRKLLKLDEPVMRDTGGKVRTSHKLHIPVDPIHMDKQRQEDQQEPIYNSSVLLRK